MSSNPYALDFSGLNEGLTFLMDAIKTQRQREQQAGYTKQLTDDLNNPRTSPAYTPEQINAPRPDVAYNPGTLQGGGGGVSDAITPLLGMLMNRGGDGSVPPIAPPSQPFSLGADSIRQITRPPTPDETSQMAAQTVSRPPTPQERAAVIAQMMGRGPAGAAAVQDYTTAQNLANAPEDRAMVIEKHKADVAKESAQSGWYKDRGASAVGWTDDAGIYHPPVAVQGAQVRADGTVTAAGVGAASREKVADTNAQSKEKIGAAHDRANAAIAAARNAMAKLTGENRTRAALTIAKMNSENKAAGLTGAPPTYTAEDINDIFSSILPEQASGPSDAPPAPATPNPADTPPPAAGQQPARPVQPRAIVDPKVVAKFTADPATKGMILGNKDKSGRYTVYLNGKLHGHYE